MTPLPSGMMAAGRVWTELHIVVIGEIGPCACVWLKVAFGAETFWHPGGKASPSPTFISSLTACQGILCLHQPALYGQRVISLVHTNRTDQAFRTVISCLSLNCDDQPLWLKYLQLETEPSLSRGTLQAISSAVSSGGGSATSSAIAKAFATGGGAAIAQAVGKAYASVSFTP